MTVPVTTGGTFSRQNLALAVAITGHETTGIAVCNQVRSFDVEARVRAGSARFVEKLDPSIVDEIVSRVVSAIDPGE